MFLHFWRDPRGKAVNPLKGVRGLIGRVQQVGEPVDKGAFKGVVLEEFAQQERGDRTVVVVAARALLILCPRTIGLGVVGEEVELPRRRHGPEATPADVVVELQPTPAAFGCPRPPQAMISDIPAVGPNLGDLVIDEIAHLHLRLEPGVVSGLAHVMGAEVGEHGVVVRGVAFNRRRIAFEVIEVVRIGAAMPFQEIFILLLADVMDAPILAIVEHDRRPARHGIRPEILGQVVHERVPEIGQEIIMPRLPQQNVRPGSLGAVGEEPISQGSFIRIIGDDVDSFDRKLPRSVAMDFDPGVLGEGRDAVPFEELDMNGPFPGRSSLKIVSSSRVAGDVNADVRINQILPVGGDGDDGQGIAIRDRGHQVGVGPRAAGHRARLERLGPNDGELEHFPRRSLPSTAGGDGREAVGLARAAADGDWARVNGRIGGRLRAVQRVADGGAEVGHVQRQRK